MLIKKPDGTFRVVLDYRALNLLTLKDNYPLPNIYSSGSSPVLGRAGGDPSPTPPLRLLARLWEGALHQGL